MNRGVYKLIPFYKGENTVFDVSPPLMLVSVLQDHAIIPQRFQVTSKRYSIQAKKEPSKFEKLINFLVLPNMASITDIRAVSSSYKAKVDLAHGPENVKPQVR